MVNNIGRALTDFSPIRDDLNGLYTLQLGDSDPKMGPTNLASVSNE